MQQPLPGQRSKEGTTIAIKKEIAHDTKHKNNHPSGSSGGLPDRMGEKTFCSIYLPPTDQVIEEELRDLLEQLPAPDGRF